MDKLQVCEFAGSMYRFRCYAIADYHKYWIDKAAKIKNEKFTRQNGLILSLKTPGHADFSKAVGHFSRLLIDSLKKLDGPQVGHIFIVPSSTAGKVSLGLEQVAENICKADGRFKYHRNALIRNRSIDKLAHGGNRGGPVHLDSITYMRPVMAPPLVIILDDVCTTGNSLIACHDKVKIQDPRATVIALVLGRTVDE